MSSEVFVFGTQGFGWRGRIMLADPGTDEAFSPDGRQIIHHCEADGTLQLRSLDWLSIPPPRSPE
jgi:hypothetical protein